MELILYFSISFISAGLTQYLGIKFKNNFCKSSALVSLMFFILFSILPYDGNTFSKIAFGASFIGMSNLVYPFHIRILLSSLIFSICFQVLFKYYGELGGALGFSAFISLFFAVTLFRASKILHLQVTKKINSTK
ncbi:MAG: hypothetical protein CL674_11850 [Bdellovibrionaceae bacterium]|nr:hypothetical protein [Pseudobdellovibrionaceae bacterium]|tara:strand:- start:1738 stop:2142 length:405 start_codon:yes stop_codon:yes gene_type:complete